MGIAIAGQIPSGIAIAGQQPSGIAVAGQNIFAGGSSWQLLSQATVSGMGMQSVTLDTTDANLIIFLCAAIGDTFYGLSDNQGNTWINAGAIPTSARNPNLYFYYCINPNTSSSHTVQSGGDYKTTIVSAFKGSNTIAADKFTQTNGVGTPATVQIPTLTPSSSPGLVLAVTGLNAVEATINSGFTIVDLIPRSSTFGAALAYLINTDTNPLSPTWSYSNWPIGGDSPVAMLNFIPITPWQFLTSVAVTAPATTSTPIDTTNAKLLVVTAFGTGGLIFSDSESNTWTEAVLSPVNTANNQVGIYYCVNPKTSATHTVSSLTQFGSAIMQAFSGSASISLDQTISGIYGNGYNYTTPPITPSASNSLVIASIGLNGSPASIDQGFTMTNPVNYVAAVAYGGATAYLIQSQAAVVGPTWNWSTLSVNSFATASFKGV